MTLDDGEDDVAAGRHTSGCSCAYPHPIILNKWGALQDHDPGADSDGSCTLSLGSGAGGSSTATSGAW